MLYLLVLGTPFRRREVDGRETFPDVGETLGRGGPSKESVTWRDGRGGPKRIQITSSDLPESSVEALNESRSAPWIRLAPQRRKGPGREGSAGSRLRRGDFLRGVRKITPWKEGG